MNMEPIKVSINRYCPLDSFSVWTLQTTHLELSLGKEGLHPQRSSTLLMSEQHSPTQVLWRRSSRDTGDTSASRSPNIQHGHSPPQLISSNPGEVTCQTCESKNPTVLEATAMKGSNNSFKRYISPYLDQQQLLNVVIRQLLGGVLVTLLIVV